MSFVVKPTRAWTIECKGAKCGQRISKLLTGKIVNDVDGPGGKRGEDHICPGRLETGSRSSGEWAWMNSEHICKRCSLKFSGVFVDCPFCFKLCCQRCGLLQDWRVDKPHNRCKRCDFMYLAWMTISQRVSDGVCMPLSGDELEMAKMGAMGPEINTKTALSLGITQIFDCNNRGHILRKGDKNCRVCQASVIR